jgi:hypothetical protein
MVIKKALRLALGALGVLLKTRHEHMPSCICTFPLQVHKSSESFFVCPKMGKEKVT